MLSCLLCSTAMGEHSASDCYRFVSHPPGCNLFFTFVVDVVTDSRWVLSELLFNNECLNKGSDSRTDNKVREM